MTSSTVPASGPAGLRYWRRLRDFSQRELALRVGVTAAQVSAWERGQAVPRLRHVQRLLAVLEAPSIAALFPECQ